MSSTDPAAAPETSPRRAPTTAPRTGHPFAAGLSLFAGVILIVAGVSSALTGIAALLDDNVYVRVEGYVYAFDLTTWGWIHLVIGVLLACTGGAIIAGRAWARVAGIILAALSALANVMFLPYAPWWSLLLVGVAVAVIWALSVHDPEQARG